jgi:hypothetical protein
MVCDLLHKVELMHAAGTQFHPANAQEVIQNFLETLTILDNKGLALLAFDGIIVAGTTFVAEKGNVFRRQGLARWLAIIIIILALSAAAACLLVSEVAYPFLSYVTCNAPHSLDFSNEISRLASHVEWRTDYFHFAWWCSIIDIALFLVMFWASLDFSLSRPR